MRRICAFSGKRGGFGAYVPLMRLIEEAPDLELHILLGDMHASTEFGGTADEARRLFPAAELDVIEMGAGRGDSPLVRAENLAAGLAGAARVLERRRPDVVLVHGDRGEHLMVAFAELNLGIPVAHTQGGERSGNIDDVQRHAITKLAHLHFPETETAAERIRGLGEEDWRIHVVGSTYVDRIVQGLYTAPAEARRRHGLEEGEDFLLVLVHPDTFLTAEQNAAATRAVVDAARGFGLRCVASYPCSDPGYEAVLGTLRETAAEDWLSLEPNIDNDDYLGLMAGAAAMAGNSSSALVEAPYFGLPAVNVGARQRGRERDANVIDAAPTADDVTAALRR